jgi:hypothetical protein
VCVCVCVLGSVNLHTGICIHVRVVCKAVCVFCMLCCRKVHVYVYYTGI